MTGPFLTSSPAFCPPSRSSVSCLSPATRKGLGSADLVEGSLDGIQRIWEYGWEKNHILILPHLCLKFSSPPRPVVGIRNKLWRHHGARAVTRRTCRSLQSTARLQQTSQGLASAQPDFEVVVV